MSGTSRASRRHRGRSEGCARRLVGKALIDCSGVRPFPRLPEIQSVSVRITDAELSSSVEGVINVLYKLDPFAVRRLTGKISLRGFELLRLEQLVEPIDLIGSCTASEGREREVRPV